MVGLLEILWLLPGLFLGSFLPWYFFEEPRRIIGNYFAYAAAFLEIISIPFLLRTLVSPWKSITDEYKVKGFNFSELAQSLTLNVTSRVIGFLFRSITLVIGLTAQILLLLFFLAYFIAWIIYPGVLIAAIAYFTSTSL